MFTTLTGRGPTPEELDDVRCALAALPPIDPPA